MAKKIPMNEYIVTGTAKLRGVACIVHAHDRQEAIKKANAGEHVGEMEYDTAECADWDFTLAEVNVEDV
jgi:hypothetical protein